MEKSIQSLSLTTTQRIAKELAKILAKIPRRKGAFVLALRGELGAGKTSFVQGMAKGLGVEGNVASPTFLIVKSYQIPGRRTLFHIDCYRLKNPKELLSLGWREMISDPNNIVAVEWADRVKKIIPKDALWLFLSHQGGNLRSITVSSKLK